MRGKHMKQQPKARKITTFLFLVFVLALTILSFVQTTMAKYVIKKDIVIGIQTADYFFFAEAEQDEYITKERNKCSG